MIDKRVVVLGASGMLGSMVTDVLARENSLQVVATVRSESLLQPFSAAIPRAQWQLFEVEQSWDFAAALRRLGRVDWIVNAIGITKPYVRDDNAYEIERAIRINSCFPLALARYAEEIGARVLQIATDCVFSGVRGRYTEKDKHDATDVYGKTKSLGEVYSDSTSILRCSIIGPEPKSHVFLLDWFRRQPQGASLNGFTNHLWNGVTTLQFAKICHGIICSAPELRLPRLSHIIPHGKISKYDLLRCFADCYQRSDLLINRTEAATVIDRTLETVDAEMNQRIWAAAGYPARPPAIPEMVAELAAFDDYCMDMNL